MARFANYLKETREELRKCTWPTWEELKGSTAVVMVATLLLGLFTALVDLVFAMFARHIMG
ncbi:preprotein translocase subunit SecE [Limisphaera ngatamarikiensis]|uniref:Protein translocase subunit SecE n=1 Tax=Limisphaera ngatamarikiensis TaxID=1324935 RepID=A0A6M1RML7_9BACT|nr:preprotein translocase subunit SecE [Limisphaera ngatamarikiensis]